MTRDEAERRRWDFFNSLLTNNLGLNPRASAFSSDISNKAPAPSLAGHGSPQTNGICERFHQTVLNEFYRVTFRKKLYADLEALQEDLDKYLDHYNQERTHQGKRCQGRTPRETFNEGKEVYAEKNLSKRKAA